MKCCNKECNNEINVEIKIPEDEDWGLYEIKEFDRHTRSLILCTKCNKEFKDKYDLL